jgi:membrane protein required for colicin V production
MDFSVETLSMVEFNYFDAVIGAIILILGIKGFVNGFIKEIFGLAGLVGGVYFASRLSEKAADFIASNFVQLNNTALLNLLGFFVILIIIWFSVTLVGMLISKLVNLSGLGFINRLLGFVTGAGKNFIIFALIITALSNVSLINNKLEKHVADSQIYPYLKEAGSYLINLDPESFEVIQLKEETAVKKDTNITQENDNNQTAGH